MEKKEDELTKFEKDLKHEQYWGRDFFPAAHYHPAIAEGYSNVAKNLEDEERKSIALRKAANHYHMVATSPEVMHPFKLRNYESALEIYEQLGLSKEAEGIKEEIKYECQNLIAATLSATKACKGSNKLIMANLPGFLRGADKPEEAERCSKLLEEILTIACEDIPEVFEGKMFWAKNA